MVPGKDVLIHGAAGPIRVLGHRRRRTATRCAIHPGGLNFEIPDNRESALDCLVERAWPVVDERANVSLAANNNVIDQAVDKGAGQAIWKRGNKIHPMRRQPRR